MNFWLEILSRLAFLAVAAVLR